MIIPLHPLPYSFFRRLALELSRVGGALFGLGLFATSFAATEFRSGSAAHVVAQPTTELDQRMTRHLADYLGRVLGTPTRVVANLDLVPSGAPAVILANSSQDLAQGALTPAESPEAFTLQTLSSHGRALVRATGRTDKGLKRAIQRLIILSEQTQPGWVVPDLNVTETPWIPRREWTLCAWSPELVRGMFSNPYADKRMNVWLYSDRQVAAYVDMFDWFGFSGAQLMDTVANYAAVGSPEAYRGRLRMFTQSLRQNAQDVTLWVWASQFNGFGWVDRDVVSTPQPGLSAFEDPAVRATFERYYDGYAELAPDVDLLITHFYDPGTLKDRKDVFAYMGLLRDKFVAKNPKVKLGVDFWYAGEEAAYMQELVDHGFKDVLFLANTMPHTYPPGRREQLHENAKAKGLEIGVWGWHTAEIESDQIPTMHVNAQLLAHFYRQMKAGAHSIHPFTYWSEMEACHLVNIFSLYAAGQLLWNPDRDPDAILREIAHGIWGPKNGPVMLDVLHLIQDTRSGPTWDTYWMWLPTHRLGTEDANEDLRRVNEAISRLETLKTDTAYVSKFPLPFPPATFVELTLPHLWQIKSFAEFRLKFESLTALAKNGASSAELTAKANAIWDPIRDYSTWIGAFGPPEAVTQENMLMAFAKEHQLTLTPPAWLRARDADRQLQWIQNRQRASASPLEFSPDDRFLWKEFLWTLEKGHDRFQLLIDQGWVTKTGDNSYRLSNWESFRGR
ncbi:MAG TPA: hypothetical protein PLN52_02245 [Opitutaceae bacterium]|nr:hypothetical protein [Opitutaceae bacterium]